MSQQPTVGRIVHVIGSAAEHNGAAVAPGIITRVWGEHPDGGWTVDLTIFPDAAAPRSSTSARLFDDEATAREYTPSTAAYWPPRV